MQEFPVLSELGIMVVAAAVGVVVARHLKIPSILAYLAAGVVLGPVAGVLASSDPVELFAEVGVALLLFLVGMELSVEKIRALGTTALATGLLQVALTFAAAFGVAHLLGYSGTAAVVLGLVAAFSSTVVVVKLLDRGGGLDALPGRLAIGILLVQDVLVAVALTFFSAMGESGGTVSPWGALGVALGVVGVMGVAGAGVSRWILPPFLDWLEESGEGLFLFALAWAFAFILVAESFHLSVELGAFLAGVLLAQLRQSEGLWRRTRPLVDFFLAVFFISLGSHMDLGAVGGNWGAAAAMASLVLVGKPVIIAIVLALLGQPPRVAVVAGITLGQVSEFAFILTGLAIASGSVAPEMAGFVGLLGMVTIGASAFLVPRADTIADWMDRAGLLRILPGRRGSGPPTPPPARAGHVVVVGMNTLGRRLVQGFTEMGQPVLAVDTDVGKLAGLPGDALVGDLTHPDVAEAAGLVRARLVVSALQIEEVTNLLAHQCRERGIPTSMHAFDPSLSDELLEIGVDHLIVPKQEGAALMESRLRGLGVLD